MGTENRIADLAEDTDSYIENENLNEMILCTCQEKNLQDRLLPDHQQKGRIKHSVLNSRYLRYNQLLTEKITVWQTSPRIKGQAASIENDVRNSAYPLVLVSL